MDNRPIDFPNEWCDDQRFAWSGHGMDWASSPHTRTGAKQPAQSVNIPGPDRNRLDRLGGKNGHVQSSLACLLDCYLGGAPGRSGFRSPVHTRKLNMRKAGGDRLSNPQS